MTGLDQEKAAEGPGNRTPCPIVGIGASAGGLEAFEAFFSHMPADTGMAFVLVQHLDPRHDTLMPELLSRHTAMPVQLVSEDTPIGTDCVYVIPPNATVTIDECVLRLNPRERTRGRRMPIDSFFRSLAEDQGDDAVGIVLSGTGADGALGLRALREHGAMTMVQAPASARYDSMPRSAILTGMVDHVVPVEEMPFRLMEHLRNLLELRGRGGPEGLRHEVEENLSRICTVLRRRTGHDFSRYKQSTLVRRVRRRMTEVRTDSAAVYLELLAEDPREVDHLFRDLLIGVTHFFRDPEAFAALERKAIPKLFEGKGVDDQVRVWVPGCSTGEEAYSLAMLLLEHAGRLDQPPRVQIFATDIDTQALETARQAWYPEQIAEQVGPDRLARFFGKHGNLHRVAKEVREMCLFSSHNLITDPPFSRLDLISCRNLLIYLEPDLQNKLIPLCHYALRPGGFLFLGPSESVATHPELFRAVDKRLRIFQAKDVILRPPVSFPLAERSRFAVRGLGEGLSRAPRADVQSLAQVFESILLEHYSPACVLVHERGDIVYFSPRTGRYLEPPAGAPRLNVLEMARPGLRLDLRTALHKAVTTRALVSREAVPYEADGQVQRVNLSVRPMLELGEDQGLYMVVFQEVREPGPAPAAGDTGLPEDLSELATVQRLESELRSTKDHLHATLEELESSNEELLSSNEELLAINEELQSTNEELQTSKEELQSVNEELETINAELKKKIEDLERAEEHRVRLAAIVESSHDAIIGKTLEGTVTSWNAGAERLYGYTEQEAVGRNITFLAPPERIGELGPIFERLRRGQRVEPFETVRLRKDGTPLNILLVVSPILDAGGRIVEASAIAHDITAQKRTEEALHEAARRKDEFLAMLGHELRNPLAPIRNCLLILEQPGATPEQAGRARRTLERQVQHLTRLVDDLLDVSRISQGKILLRTGRLDLAALVRTAVEDHRVSAAEAGETLELDLPDRPLWVNGDPTRLAQCVGNVLHNAVKFTERGGRIDVAVRADEGQTGQAVVSVRDTGVGVDPETLERLFEPFSQADSGIDRSRGGLGLGLALVKRLVELHGGTASAHSQGLGHGTRVELRIPLQERRDEPPAPSARSAGRRRARRCLLIEDNADAAETMGLLLELYGHEVRIARDGREGLEAARRFLPEVVFCDIGLPNGLDGYEVARRMRQDPSLRVMSLVALTGYGQEEDQRRARDAGFDVHLTKPADPERLERLLAELP